MTTTPIVTMSWDDGHPLDCKLADLLDRYGINATFYIPRQSQLATLDEPQVASLSERFEIGGHTLDHLALTTLPAAEAARQITQCKHWIEDVTGRSCDMFCPPLGKFDDSHLQCMADAGYLGMRSVELLQTSGPQPVAALASSDSQSELWTMPTTIQSHPHGRTAYLRNALKRRRFATAISTLFRPALSDWVVTAERLLKQVRRQGGVFHLWGHSWEIEEHNQWKPLERVLAKLSRRIKSGELKTLTNAQVCALRSKAVD